MKYLYLIFALLAGLCVSIVEAQVSVETTSGTTTAVVGSLQVALDGSWTNNGTLTAGNSTILLNGTGLQTITNASGAFKHLTINKAGGNLQAGGNFTVNGTMTLTSGDVNLNGKVITLGASALLAESAGNTVKGATGHIESTRDLNAPTSNNVAGLGFEITSAANLGSTQIIRAHAAQSGNGNTGIARYFDVSPTNNSGLNATVIYRYDDSELAGQTEANLALYRSTDNGSTWSAEGGTADGGANTVTQSSIAALSRWTAAEQSLTFPAVIADAGADKEFCAGGSAQIGGSPTASGGMAPYTYSWSPTTGLDDATLANPTANPTGTTTYTVTVTDANSQTAMDTVVVTVNPNPVADAGADQSIAPGGSVQIGGSPTASGGTGPYTFAWSPATGLDDATLANPTAGPVVTTEYIVIITDANGCTDSDTTTVTVTAGLVASAGSDKAFCAGGSVQIGGSPTAMGGMVPYTYSWAPAAGLDDAALANPTASPSTTTQYIVTVADANSQTDMDTVVVTVNPNPVADAGADQGIAPGGSAQIGGSPTASGGSGPYTFAWTPTTGLDDATLANPNANPGATTEYIVIITDANGCTDSDTTTVTVTAGLVASAGSDKAFCAGGSAQIGGSPTASGGMAPYTYAWSPATGLDDATLANPTASPSSTTTYTVMVTDANNQTATDEVVVTVNPLPVADAGTDKNTAPGGNVQIGGSPTASGGLAPYTYAWTPTTGLDDATLANPAASPGATTEYIVIVTDANGCAASDTMTVTVTAPQCAISALTAGVQTACDPQSNSYTQEVTVTFTNPPATGTLDVNGQQFAIGSSPRTVTLTGLVSDGQFVDVTATFSDNQACTLIQTGLFIAPNSCTPGGGAPHNFLLLADVSIEFTGHKSSVGDIHSNNDIIFTKGSPSIHTGDVTAVDDVDIAKKNTIEGDVKAGHNIDLSGSATVTGSSEENAQVADVAIPVLPNFSSGNQDVEVPKNGSLSLTAGAYGLVEVGKDATLQLSSGTYNLLNLELKKRSVLQVNAAGGAVTINITRKLDVYEDVEMQLIAGTAADVLFNVAGSVVKIRDNTVWLGSIIAPEATVELRAEVTFTGQVCARKIEIGADAMLQQSTGPTGPQCAITALSAGAQTACDPGTNTYTQEITVTFSNAPASGTLDINGQSFAIGSSPQTVTLVGLVSDGQKVDVTAAFSDVPSCTLTRNDLFTAPASCTPVCAISALTAGTQTACDPGTNTYTQEVTVTFVNPPTSGTLDVNGQTFQIGSSPRTVTLTGLVSDGKKVDVTAEFSDEPSCTLSKADLFTAPASCTPVCAISALSAGAQTACDPGTNTYTQEVTVTFVNPPASGTLDVNGQTFQIGSSPQTVTLVGLISDGQKVDVTVAFSDEPSCTLSNTDLFTAPASCTPVCTITALSAGQQTDCDSLTNTYTQEIMVTFANAPGNGTLDVNGQSFQIGNSPQTVTLTGLPADSNLVDVTATFSEDDQCSFTGQALFRAPPACGKLLHSFVLLAEENIEFNGHQSSSGEIHSNGSIDFKKGSPSTHTGDVTAVDEIEILKNNTIIGNVTSGATVDLDNDSIVTGVIQENAQVAEFPIPDLPDFDDGGDNVIVSKKKSLILAPGTYKTVKVKDRGTLSLSTGQYNLSGLDMNKKSVLEIDVTNGPVTINLTKDLDISDDVEMRLTGGSSPDVRFNVAGSVDFGEDVVWFGSILAPDANVELSEGVTFTGSICADRITLQDDVVVLYHSNGSGTTAPLTKLVLRRGEQVVAANSDSTEKAAKSIARPVEFAGSDVLPTEFTLEQNYPNPFNPTTTILFELPEAAQVKLTIYNLLGQRIRTLVDNRRPAGYHTIVWDTRDDFGRNVASGIYIYRIEAGTFLRTKKMTLVR